MIKMQDVDKSYFVAFLEGEGTVSLRYREAKDKRFWFHGRIVIFNTEKDVLEYLQKVCCAGILGIQVRRNSVKPEYRLEITKYQDLKRILEEIFPFFHMKKKKKLAELLLEFLEINNIVRKTQMPCMWKGNRYHYPKRAFEIYEEIRSMNKK